MTELPPETVRLQCPECVSVKFIVDNDVPVCALCGHRITPEDMQQLAMDQLMREAAKSTQH